MLLQKLDERVEVDVDHSTHPEADFLRGVVSVAGMVGDDEGVHTVDRKD